MMSPETAMKQAVYTAEVYFDGAYAYFEDRKVKNPDPVLVAAFVRACTTDFQTSMRAKTISLP